MTMTETDPMASSPATDADAVMPADPAVVDAEPTANEPTPTASDTTRLAELEGWQRSVISAERRVQERLESLNIAKERAKEAKTAWEGAVSYLQEVITQQPEKLPLFDGSAQAVDADESPEPEAWRSISLRELTGVPDRVYKALDEHTDDGSPRPITTIGDLADWQKDKGDFWAKDIKGVGEAAADKLADALASWWAEHPEMTPSTPDVHAEEPAIK